MATTTDPLYAKTVSMNIDMLDEGVGTQTPHSAFNDAQTQTIGYVCHVGGQLSLQSDHKETQTVCYIQHSGTITENQQMQVCFILSKFKMTIRL